MVKQGRRANATRQTRLPLSQHTSLQQNKTQKISYSPHAFTIPDCHRHFSRCCVLADLPFSSLLSHSAAQCGVTLEATVRCRALGCVHYNFGSVSTFTLSFALRYFFHMSKVFLLRLMSVRRVSAFNRLYLLLVL